MRRNSSDLLFAMLFAALSLSLGLPTFDIGPIRIILAIPMVFVVPGYAVVSALFPKTTFTFAEQILLSVGASITLTILGGFTLYWTPWGLQAVAWVILLACITYTASAISLVQRNKRGAFFSQRKHLAISSMQVFGIGAASLIFVGAIAIARTPVSASNVSGYSQLWMLPVNYTQRDVKLGLRSEEFTDVQYRLEVRVGDTLIREWPLIKLQPDQQWEVDLELPVVHSVGRDVEAQLYRLDKPDTVYRRVVLRGM